MPESGLSYRFGLSLDYQIELSATRNRSNRPTVPFRDYHYHCQYHPLTCAESSTILPVISTSPFTNFYLTLSRASHSPSPLGDWPRRDATSLPARSKRNETHRHRIRFLPLLNNVIFNLNLDHDLLILADALTREPRDQRPPRSYYMCGSFSIQIAQIRQNPSMTSQTPPLQAIPARTSYRSLPVDDEITS